MNEELREMEMMILNGTFRPTRIRIEQKAD